MVGAAENLFLQWSVTLVFTGLTALMLWADVRIIGRKHAHADAIALRRAQEGRGSEEHNYRPWYGIAVCALAQAPLVLVLLVDVALYLLLPDAFYITDNIMRLLYSSMHSFYNELGQLFPWLYFAFPVFFTLLPAIGYANGRAMDARQMVFLRRNEKTLRSKQKGI